MNPEQYRIHRNAYHKMLRRCFNPNDPRFSSYGARGITVCDRWQGKRGFDNFIIDIGMRPSGKYSLDRIDNDGNYEPGNVRWATARTQSRNRTDNIFVYFRGERMVLQDAINLSGLKKSTVAMRIFSYGWSTEKALNTPVGGII